MSTAGTGVENRAELSVGEVATLSGVAGSAIRFYEEHGLIRSERTAGNQRRFRHDVPCRVKMIRVAQRIGMSVAEIGEALRLLPERHQPTLTDWNRLSAHLRQEVARRIADLEQVLTDFNGGNKLCELAPINAATRSSSGTQPIT